MWSAFLESDYYAALPLLTIWLVLQFTLVLDALIKEKRQQLFTYASIGLLLTAVGAIITFSSDTIGFMGMITTGGYACFFDVLFCLAGVMTLLSAQPYLEKFNYPTDEFYLLVLYSISGMMLIAHSNNLLMLFVGIEIMSISFYVLSGYLRTDISSIESALKYFLLGAFSTGFLLYGMALIYGATGSIDYATIATAVAQNNLNFPTLLLVGAGLMVVGLSFKVAAFPFHIWVPDVYQGEPTVVTGFMSTAGKAAAFSAFIPIMSALMPEASGKLPMILAVISATSMLFGNIVAIKQQNLKRMLSYSSVAHAGYILIGIVAGNQHGMSGVMYYLAAYLFMQIGAFAILSVLEAKEGKHLEMKDMRGLSKTHPIMAALMAIFMFSLVGIPPFAGFFGKYYIFTAAIEAGYTWLTIVGIIASMISFYFYLGLVVAMYFQKSEDNQEELATSTGFAGITLIMATFGVFFLGFFPGLIVNITDTFF
jgi:NADH-quinone oxidoreductase subunit N